MHLFVKKYIQYIQFEKRYSKHTIIAYENDLSQFIVFFESYAPDAQWENVTSKDLRVWVANFMENMNTSKTVNRKISVLKSFFHFLNLKELFSGNPAASISSPKIKKTLPKFIEEKQINHLLDDIEFEDNFEGLRNKTIIHLFYFTGIRLSELIELKLIDIDLNQQKIKVLGKRNKERIIPLHKEVCKLLKVYIESRKIQLKDSQNAYLFITLKDKPLYPKLVYNIVKKSIALVSTIDKKSPHILRHTFATHLLNHGAELNAIKELLGHASLAATQVYTHNSFEKLKNAYQKSHPRD